MIGAKIELIGPLGIIHSLSGYIIKSSILKIQDKHIDVGTKYERYTLKLPDGGITMRKLGMRTIVAGRTGIDDLIIGSRQLTAQSNKPVVIGAFHIYIDIIIPRDESPMSDSSDHGSSCSTIADAVIPAEIGKAFIGLQKQPFESYSFSSRQFHKTDEAPK